MRTRSRGGELGIWATLLAFGSLAAFAGCTGDISSDASGVDEAGALPDATAPSNGDASTRADSSTDAADDGPPPGPVTPTYEDFDINHFLLTGQSNAVANGGDPPLTTAPLDGYANLMFDTGVMPMKSCDGNGCFAYDPPTSLVPLVGGDQFFGYAVETAAASIGYEASHLAKARYEFGARAGYPSKHDMLVSVHGRSGNTYWCLRKGFCAYNQESGYLSPFAQAMSEVESAKALAAASSRSYVVRAVGAIHGESDHYAYVFGTSEFPLPGTDGTPGKIKDYADALVEWQHDLDVSIKQITGQKQDIPLLISGLSGWTTVRESKLAQMQLDAHVRAPGKVIYVTPAYPMEVREDCLHFSNAGQRHLGEYFAKVYGRVILGGQAWEPVRPKSITRAGNVVTVVYYVPVPPLVIDTKLVSPAENDGFDFWDNGNRVGITNVAITAPDTVTITLSNAPSGTNMRLTYAQNQPLTETGGTAGCIGNGLVYAGGARGNLRDSDDTPSLFGNNLSNWGVNFEASVP